MTTNPIIATASSVTIETPSCPTVITFADVEGVTFTFTLRRGEFTFAQDDTSALIVEGAAGHDLQCECGIVDMVTVLHEAGTDLVFVDEVGDVVTPQDITA